MQLICPNCGENITAENINIHDKVAVCSHCNHLFSFNVSESTQKQKRRKVHQPQNMTVTEHDETLSLAYRTNFRLDKDEPFLSSLLMGILFGMMTIVTTGELINEGALFTIPLLFGVVSILAFYRLALIVFNQTVIDMDAESIAISRQPLPSLANITNKMSTYNIKSIDSEETEVSKKEAYDTPRYHVWATMMDGSRKVIVKDVTEEYGIFIAQYLNENLQHADENVEQINTSRLADAVTIHDLDVADTGTSTLDHQENKQP